MIEIRDFSFRYREDEHCVLDGIDLCIEDGSFIGITGAAGSGKSTLTYALNGVIPHCYPGDFYGSVRVFGLDTCECSLTDLSAVVGSVCQDVDSQFVASVVEDELLYGLENFGTAKEEIPVRIDRTLRDMGIADLRERSISSLSGGQKQKVALACILVLNPKVLLLDEPTAELDPASSKNVFDLLRDLACKQQITVIAVEQKIALLAQYADRILVVGDKGILMDGSPSEILAQSDRLKQIGINCPRSTTLVNRLRQAGFYTGAACKNVEEASEILCGMMSLKDRRPSVEGRRA